MPERVLIFQHDAKDSQIVFPHRASVKQQRFPAGTCATKIVEVQKIIPD